MNQPSRTKFVVACIFLLGVVCLIGGGILTYKGYSGDLMTGGGLAAISGLIGMLSQRTQMPPSDPTPEPKQTPEPPTP